MGVPDVTCAPIASARSTIGGVDLAMGIIGVIGLVITGILTAAASITFVAGIPSLLAVWASLMIMSCLMAINLINKAMMVLFHYKLACIDGERCLIGEVMKIEKNPDGDLTFDMKLAPVQPLTTPTQFQTSYQGSTLVYSDPGAGSRGWVFKPESGAGFVSATHIPLLHCEIEGSYLNDWLTALLAMLWSLVAFATAVGALAVALTAIELIPIIGWIIAGVLFLIALIATLLGIHMGFSGPESVGTGEPDVPVSEQTPGATGPTLTDAANNKVAVGDFITLTGLHVLDCGHAEDTNDDGTSKGTWCEIHPVRAIGKTTKYWYDTYSTASLAGDESILNRYCDALKAFVASKKDALIATSSYPLEHPKIG
jgi:hypothetical protein